MKQIFLLLILTCQSFSLKSQKNIDLCDSLKLFFHGRESCYSKANDVYKCGIILTQRIISPALYYYHFKFKEKEWLSIKDEVYYPKNLNFINNLEIELANNFLELTFRMKNGKQKYWKFRITKDFNFVKKLELVEGSLEKELLKFEG